MTQFYPLGWSYNGKFAYVLFSEGYDGGNEIRYFVKDTNTGENVWEKSVLYLMAPDDNYIDTYSDAEPDAIVRTNGGEAATQLFNYAWATNEAEVIAKLAQEGIQVIPATALPEQVDGVKFTVNAKKQDDSSTTYTLESDQYEPALIVEEDLDVIGASLAGVIKSPSSPHIEWE